MTTDRIVVTPAESGLMGVERIQWLHENRDRLMPIGLAGLDDYFIPLEPGNLTVVQAQTHNGKSWFMNRWMRRMLRHLADKGRNEVIVWVDTEMTANHLAMSSVSRISGVGYSDIISNRGLDMGKLFAAAVAIAEQPVYMIATRLGRDGTEVHLTNISNGLKMLVNGGVDGTPRKVAAIFIDYLQALPVDPITRRSKLEEQRRIQVSRDVDTCRAMGALFDAPVILGVQAKQQPDETAVLWKRLRIPAGLYDGQETANIGQRADRILALSVPARNFPRGTVIEYRGNSWAAEDNMMFVHVAKQRGDNFPAGDTFLYRLDGKTADPNRAMINLWSEWTP